MKPLTTYQKRVLAALHRLSVDSDQIWWSMGDVGSVLGYYTGQVRRPTVNALEETGLIVCQWDELDFDERIKFAEICCYCPKSYYALTVYGEQSAESINAKWDDETLARIEQAVHMRECVRRNILEDSER